MRIQGKINAITMCSAALLAALPSFASAVKIHGQVVLPSGAPPAEFTVQLTRTLDSPPTGVTPWPATARIHFHGQASDKGAFSIDSPYSDPTTLWVWVPGHPVEKIPILVSDDENPISFTLVVGSKIKPSSSPRVRGSWNRFSRWVEAKPKDQGKFEVCDEMLQGMTFAQLQTEDPLQDHRPISTSRTEFRPGEGYASIHLATAGCLSFELEASAEGQDRAQGTVRFGGAHSHLNEVHRLTQAFERLNSIRIQRGRAGESTASYFKDSELASELRGRLADEKAHPVQVWAPGCGVLEERDRALEELQPRLDESNIEVVSIKLDLAAPGADDDWPQQSSRPGTLVVPKDHARELIRVLEIRHSLYTLLIGKDGRVELASRSFSGRPLDEVLAPFLTPLKSRGIPTTSFSDKLLWLLYPSQDDPSQREPLHIIRTKRTLGTSPNV